MNEVDESGEQASKIISPEEIELKLYEHFNPEDEETSERLNEEQKELLLENSVNWIKNVFPETMDKLMKVEENPNRARDLLEEGKTARDLPVEFADVQRRLAKALHNTATLDTDGRAHEEIYNHFFRSKNIKHFSQERLERLKTKMLGPISALTLFNLEERIRSEEDMSQSYTPISEIVKHANIDAYEGCDYMIFAGFDEDGYAVYNAVQIKTSRPGEVPVEIAEVIDPNQRVLGVNAERLFRYSKELEKEANKYERDNVRAGEVRKIRIRPLVVIVPAHDGHKDIDLYGRISEGSSLINEFRQQATRANYFVGNRRGEVAA